VKFRCWTCGLLLFISEGNGGNLSTNLEMITNRSQTVTNGFCVYLELDGKLCPLASLLVVDLALRYIYVINVGDHMSATPVLLNYIKVMSVTSSRTEPRKFCPIYMAVICNYLFLAMIPPLHLLLFHFIELLLLRT